MVDPVTLSLIGQGISGGAGVLSGLLGKQSQDAATAYNYAANNANLQRQDQAAFIQQLLAREYQQLAQAGNTNARGDRTEYIPGVGWITTPSDASAALISASDGEQRARLTGDSLIRRRGLQENEQRRVQEGLAADAALQQFTQQPDYSVQSLRGELLNRATTDTNKAFDRTNDRIGTQALRSGASNAGEVLQSVNNQRADAVRGAGADVNNQARLLFEQLEGARTGRASSLYSMLAARASGFDDAAFLPTNVNESLQANQANQRGNALGIADSVISGRSTPGGAVRNIEPNFSTANLFGGIGSNIGGALEETGSRRLFQQLLQAQTDKQNSFSAAQQKPRYLGNQRS